MKRVLVGWLMPAKGSAYWVGFVRKKAIIRTDLPRLEKKRTAGGIREPIIKITTRDFEAVLFFLESSTFQLI
ncbi:hypothetical protein ASE33_13680 [Pseudomonas sp. Root9]|nr:hypothetical protein ASE33_13680 [Pseudomonas sp. Root9]